MGSFQALANLQDEVGDYSPELFGGDFLPGGLQPLHALQSDPLLLRTSTHPADSPTGPDTFPVEDGDARFFFNSLTNINIRLAKTSTLTSYVFSTSVATQVVNGGTCLQVALFADQAAAGTRCRRRRELAEFSDKIDVSPTPVVPIQASAIVAELSEKNDFVQPIESSHAEVLDKEYEEYENRFLLYLTSYTTTTSTLTTFSFSTTTATVTLGNNFAADAALTCIPSGYFVC